MAIIFSWTVVLFLIANSVVFSSSAPYDRIYRDEEASQELTDQPRQAAQVISGLVGTAVGSAATPVLGPFGPIIGTVIGTIVGQAISQAATNAFGNMQTK